jgi:hypothetical protein
MGFITELHGLIGGANQNNWKKGKQGKALKIPLPD